MHCRFRRVGRYESTGGWCWAAAKMRTGTPWFVRFVGKTQGESSHFLRSLIFCGRSNGDKKTKFLNEDDVAAQSCDQTKEIKRDILWTAEYYQYEHPRISP